MFCRPNFLKLYFNHWPLNDFMCLLRERGMVVLNYFRKPFFSNLVPTKNYLPLSKLQLAWHIIFVRSTKEAFRLAAMYILFTSQMTSKIQFIWKLEKKTTKPKENSYCSLLLLFSLLSPSINGKKKT